VYGLCERTWDLRDNVSADDAIYIALAESLNCHFLDLTAQPA
jgi:predicted nucleic acid-binding protein